MTKRFFFALLALVLMPVVAVSVLWASGSFAKREIPIYGQLPAFELTEKNGETLGLESFKGSTWIASFLFTSCKGQCPLIAKKVQALQKKFAGKDRVKLVSFSVDPERDTPEVLTRYATQYEPIPGKWFFLTGTKGAVDSLAINGFRLATGGRGGEEDILHSFKLVLVDSEGRIRGYYDAFDDSSLKALVSDTSLLGS